MNVQRLRQLLSDRGIRADAVAFSCDVSDAYERYCIRKDEDGMWEVYYAERGQKGGLKRFDQENIACDYLLTLLNMDQSVWR